MNTINNLFVTAGDAIFTVVPSEKAKTEHGFADHYTYRVERVEFAAKGNYPASVRYFVKVLTGQDNTSDYTYLGMLEVSTGVVKLTAKSAFPETAKRVRLIQRVMSCVWQERIADMEQAGWQIKHEGKCAKCGKTLTVPESIDAGFGPECVKTVTGMKLAAYVAALKTSVN